MSVQTASDLTLLQLMQAIGLRLWAHPEDEWAAETRTTLRAAINAARLP